MEAGFRKLWSRKKSFGTADTPSHRRDLPSSHGGTEKSHPPVPVVIRDGRSSMASSRQQHDRPYSRDPSGGARDLSLTPSNAESGRTKSNHRIQPMLVGISRPDTAGKERPGTSGSLQSAVQRAADSVGKRPSDPPVSQPIPVKNVPKPAIRHIDIFSVAASVPTSLSRYNEDIAERNIDTFRLALENTPYVYDPSSKYQEEVAIRNAYLPYKSKPSVDTLRKDRTTSAAGRSARSLVTPQVNGFVQHQPNRDVASPNRGAAQDQSLHHYRQLSQKSRDGSQLPSVQENRADENSILREGGLSGSLRPVYLQTRTTSRQSSASLDERMQTITEARPYIMRTLTAERTMDHRNSGGSSNVGLPEYTVSPAVYGSKPISYSNYSPMTDRHYELGNSIHAMFSAPSSTYIATPSTRRGMFPNRTIMDLTNEDSEFYSETSSALYSNYSPVIEQAESDAFQRVQPSEIHTEERRGSKGASQIVDFDPDLATPRKSVLYDPLAIIPVTGTLSSSITHSSQENSSPKPASLEERNRLAPSSSFSPISTVASWSPRSSAYVTKQTMPLSTTARVQAALEASRAIAREGPLPVLNRKAAEGTTVRARVADFEYHRDHSPLPGKTTTEPSLSTSQVKSSPIQPSIKSDTPASFQPLVSATFPPNTPASFKSNSAASVMSDSPINVKLDTPASVKSNTSARVRSESQPNVKADRQAEKSETLTAPATKSTASKHAATPSIHTSPESITSVDYINPSNAFGVRTRDFALSPRTSAPLTVVRKETAHATTLGPYQVSPITLRTRVQKLSSASPKSQAPKKKMATVGGKKTPAKAIAKEDAFDEVAFAKKQADARAALERLQRSLSEDFLTLPERPATKGSIAKSIESENQFGAPILVLPPDSKATAPVLNRAETEKNPPPSFRSTQSQMTTPPPNVRSLSAGNRSARRAAAPSTLKNVEPATNPINKSMLSPALLQALQFSSLPPKSPGEISLSSFPVPSSSRPNSQPDAPIGYQYNTSSFVGMMKRRNSTKSQGSTASVFSIPLHMVPGRTSSVRDPVPEEVDHVYE